MPGIRRLFLMGGAALAAVYPFIAVIFSERGFATEAIGPLSDALAVNALADPGRDYGRIRLLGSVGFAVPAVAVGLLYDRVGYGPAPLLYAAGAVVLALGLRGIPDRPRADLSAYAQQARGGSIRVAFAVAPRLPGASSFSRREARSGWRRPSKRPRASHSSRRATPPAADRVDGRGTTKAAGA